MMQILFRPTDELAAAIDAARNERERTAAIEDWLWRIGDIKKAAKSLGLSRQQRRRRGRPAKK